jgi:serine/threonine-protein kinase
VDLAGKYRLIAELGQGGMATVYLAVALGSSGFRKLAVVKLIRPQYASDPDLIQMFLDEARLCARLNHPNIVQTYDVGVDAGQYLMAMEYLDGVSLYTAVSRFVKTGTPFPFPLRARILSEVLEGLRYAHELRDYDGKTLDIVHRDVTPHNIFITYDGQVKLLDFGIAKATTSSVQTATGVIKGKLTYMAPEQAMCETIDARADLYAVGVMLWEAITGRRRWAAGLSDAAVFTRVASGELPEAPDAASKGFPAELDAIVLKSLAPKPEDRFQSAVEMRGALDAVLDTIEDPSSLRDLGRLLATTFAEDRKRIRQVIEMQFRAMESGRPTNPSVNLPTVHPPRGTDSAFQERRLRAEVPPDKDDAVARAEHSSKTGLTGVTGVVTRTADARPRPSLRSRTVIASLGLLGAAAVGALVVVGSRVLAHPAIAAVDGHTAAQPVGTQPLGPQPSLVSSGQSPELATATRSSAAAPPAPPASTSVPASPGETARPPEGAHALPASSPGAGRHDGVRPTPGTHAAGGPEPLGADASASPPPVASAPDDAVNVFRTPVKPKVSLERDNPWP